MLTVKIFNSINFKLRLKNLNLRFFTVLLSAMIIPLCFSSPAYSWSDHTLMSHGALSGAAEIGSEMPVAASSLKDFLIKEQKGLEELLDSQEKWARTNIAGYAPRPDDLAFRAGKGADDIVERFLKAIRINPNTKMRLYVDLLPGESTAGRPVVKPGELTTFNNYEFMEQTVYVELRQGEMVSPLMVLCSANNEPDYGFDLGLFEDNNTPFGAVYGFGIQPFGNPNLEYSSQAPFHMGFYHEAGLVFMAGPFLKQTYPEYRIHLFKTLSEYAFKSGRNYWGWRFMGWGMHYLGDLSMPYHASVLPGVSALKMIWINLKAMLGFTQSRDNAVQLVSNRHTVMEEFQSLMLKKAYNGKERNHPFMKALASPIDMVPYSDDFAREVVAAESWGKGEVIDAVMEKYLPEKLISDPSFEASGSAELKKIIELTQAHKGEEGVDKMTGAIADIFSSYSMHMRSYMLHILKSSGKAL